MRGQHATAIASDLQEIALRAAARAKGLAEEEGDLAEIAAAVDIVNKCVVTLTEIEEYYGSGDAGEYDDDEEEFDDEEDDDAV